MTPELIKSLAPVAFAALVIFAAVKDLSTFTIPNWISGTLALAFLPATLLVHIPLPDVGWHYDYVLPDLAAIIAKILSLNAAPDMRTC